VAAGTYACPIRGGSMKRFRLSTFMLLIMIVALGIVVVVQQRRAARREVGLQARMAEKDVLVNWYRAYDLELKQRLEAAAQRAREERQRPSAVEAVENKKEARNE
jgi:electron transfer flavoprotein alpha/beta subunit